MDTTSLNTSCGPIRGLSRNGVRIFRGITFATYERFGKPVLTSSWEGVYDATEYGTVSPQRSCRLATIIGEEKGAIVNEGRLCLSIYTPENADNLPVMVWIHGGAYTTGGSEEHRYSGERLVRKGHVVVVKISYRLGASGYLWDPANGIGNLGLADQKAALEWIHNNVSAFGGNPDNITLFGQSAGAHSVACLIASSGGKAVFNKAILQSPPFGIKTSSKKAKRIGKEFLRRLGKDPKSASMEEILDVQERMARIKATLPFMPVLEDDEAVSDSLVKAGLKVVVGYSDHEASPFLKPILGSLLGTSFGKSIAFYTSRLLFHKPIERYALKLRALGLQADVYHIHWYPTGNSLGSCHCIELPFILGHYEDWKDSAMLKGLEREDYERISEIYLKAWTDFANEGKFTELF